MALKSTFRPKAALLHGVKDLNELLKFNPRESYGPNKYQAKWIVLLDYSLLSALLRQAVFLSSAETKNQIEMSAGFDTLKGEKAQEN